MAERLERHHFCWSRKNWTETPISKQVRQLSAFLLDMHQPVHRLLHASMTPPEVPPHDILVEMRSLAVGGIHLVINRLEHPIVEHFDAQLTLATTDPEVAWDRIDRGDYQRR